MPHQQLLTTLLTALMVFQSLNVCAEKIKTDSLYHVLDSLITCQPEIIAQKKAKIQHDQEGLHNLSLTPEQQFSINNRLYDEYLAFNFDSALFYIQKNVQQPMLGNADTEAASLIRMAHILAVSGLFDKAGKMLDKIRQSQLSTERKIDYYNQRAELNLYRSEMAAYTPYYQDYADSMQYYRQLILEIAPEESFDYIFNKATLICEQGHTDDAIRLLERCLNKLTQGERRYSIVTSTLAYFHAKKQESDREEYYYLLSAISDVKGAILENNSLRQLAGILLERGDFERAYAYLLRASNDAQLYGSGLRSMQTARLSPLITQAYDIQRSQAQQRMHILLIVLSIITLLLLGTILYILSLIRKRRTANERISRMNEELSLHNREIQVMNTQMKESNRIKDEYIGRFLELSSNLIKRSEERSRKLNRLARDRKLEELYALLKSNADTNEGIRMFHQNFDAAFLNIYPDFITEVNKLMTEDNQFETDEKTDRLTTELRVLALIRLNITDNQKIADILRSSIATIYTYRSKIKAKARLKDSFENDVRRISTY